jgi:HSP20 family protein
MPPGPWDPFRDLMSLQERLNRLFEENPTRTGAQEPDSPMGTWAPAVDILEKEEALVLKAELPGIALEDVDLVLREDILTLRGERRFDREARQENYHCLERSYGPFSRSFRLPGGIDKEGIKATLKDGILEVTLPTLSKTSSKEISIEDPS